MLPGGVVVEARQQVHQGRLAGTGRAQAGRRPGPAWQSKCDVFQDRAYLSHIQSPHFRRQFPLGRGGGVMVPCIQRLAVFLDDLHHPAKRDQPGRHLHDQAAQVAHRQDDPDNQPDISQVGADRDLPLIAMMRANKITQQDLKPAEDVGDRPEEGVQGQQSLAAQEFLPVVLFEFVAFVSWRAKALTTRTPLRFSCRVVESTASCSWYFS